MDLFSSFKQQKEKFDLYDGLEQGIATNQLPDKYLYPNDTEDPILCKFEKIKNKKNKINDYCMYHESNENNVLYSKYFENEKTWYIYGYRPHHPYFN